jgi:hypothetical protein
MKNLRSQNVKAHFTFGKAELSGSRELNSSELLLDASIKNAHKVILDAIRKLLGAEWLE